MNTVELFSGTKSFSKVMEEYGFLTETIDNDISLDPGIVGDMRDVPDNYFPHTHMLWASPPCQGFSVAVIGRNWNRDYTPKTGSARLGMELAQKTISIIETSRPRWWFIENPRGMLRKMPFMSEFLLRAGGPAYGLVLLLWRLAPEAHRHMDQCALVEPEAYLRARRAMPCRSSARLADRNAGYQRREGSRTYPLRPLRGDT